MLNFSLMGAGRIGKMHATNISNHPQCNLSFVYDINEDFANQVAKANNAKVATTPEDAINNKNPFDRTLWGIWSLIKWKEIYKISY